VADTASAATPATRTARLSCETLIVCSCLARS
jgi:hypothetical protein